jgi:hypothetical protein
MKRIELALDLPEDELLALGEIAEQKHCTLPEMVEEAVFLFVSRNRDRRFGSSE